MSRASQVIILCEDKLHEVFVRRFLRHYGYSSRDVRVPGYPAGSGSGESFVRRAYPDELTACRSRSAKTFLIAVIDADTGSVADREKQFDQACSDRPVQSRQQEELVVHVIPKRAINTWLAFLDGQVVDEETDYKRHGYGFRRCESEIKGLVGKLYESCVHGRVPEGAPPSLEHACHEFARIKDRLH